jgi:hypothetical protein
MRLIDVDKADVNNIACYYGDHCYLEDVQTWLDEQPTIQHPEWINCIDRLPDCEWGAECPEPVLYKMKDTGTIYAGYYGTGSVWRDRYFRKYGTSSVDVDDVACWMYQSALPQSPKENE